MNKILVEKRGDLGCPCCRSWTKEKIEHAKLRAAWQEGGKWYALFSASVQSDKTVFDQLLEAGVPDKSQVEAAFEDFHNEKQTIQ